MVQARLLRWSDSPESGSPVVIVGAVRTAIGKFGGTLAAVPATELGAVVLREAVRRAGIGPAEVDEVIMGHVVQAGTGLNPARQASLLAGLPASTPAFTVNKACASGMKAATLGFIAIASGECSIAAVGGMESMSTAPFLLRKARWGYRLGDGELLDALDSDGLRDPGENLSMGLLAEGLASEFGIVRAEQDQYAALSQQKGVAASAGGRFTAETVAVSLEAKKGEAQCFAKDESPRPHTTTEALARLRPVFKGDGTVTAGNASTISDGAAAMVLMSEREADRRGVQPLGRVVSYASVGVAPRQMGLAPVPATERALAKAGLRLADIDLVELNEAFAVQCLAAMRQLSLPSEVTNVNGGAISLGHPIGASGARIIVTLLHALRERGARLGLATLCVGGGQGMAVIVENMQR